MSKTLFNRTATLAAAALLSTACGGTIEQEQALDSTDQLVASTNALSSVQFWQDFRAYSGTSGQCNNGVNISQGTALGQWTPRIELDTDWRDGGCYQKFSVVDPASEVSGLALTVDFRGQANLSGDGQCDFPGTYQIPNGSSLAWSSVWGIDTNQNPGGCKQTFSLTGRNDVALDVKFEDDAYNGQCDNTGTHTITSTRSASIVFDMDDRGGGCYQSFRLRKIACGDSICDPGEVCDADCIRCGDSICNGTETVYSCPGDCDYCGNGYCGPYESGFCTADCGSEPPPDCGMRICPEEPI